MNHVHWLGAGLSSVPGIRRLADTAVPMTVWNRSRSKAEQAIRGTRGLQGKRVQARGLDWVALESAMGAGDVVVSMLPGSLHARVAGLCLKRGAHFVSSSYLSPDMLALDGAARAAGLSFVNEVGLDPGIDHLFAHHLIFRYRDSPLAAQNNRLYFRSWCGEVPAVVNDIRYKFSWSPLGVLKALETPARWIEHHKQREIMHPWKAITTHEMQTGDGETELFEAYPDRDSVPFMQAYRLDPDWPIAQFVRGTLRLPGWSEAWAPIFHDIETLPAGELDQELIKRSQSLWEQYAYAPDELDRVVLNVELEARDPAGTTVWHDRLGIDAVGNTAGSAMARLVSWTVSLAVQAVQLGSMPPGVQAAPEDSELVADWLATLQAMGVRLINIRMSHERL